MTFLNWLLSDYPNPKISGQWGIWHILVLVLSIATIVTLALVFRKRSDKTRNIVLWVLVGLILFFEITRRIINLVKTTEFTFNGVLHTLLPRPWCAIACWSIIIATIFRKQYMFNFASFSALLCAVIYFVYPGAGFNNKYFLFENIYSISTHALLLITSITLITLKFTDFRFKNIWKDLICLAVIVAYAFLEIYVLHISDDPLYFMPGNDVHEILGVPYGAFLPIYIVFVAIWICTFYLINDFKTVKVWFNKTFKKEAVSGDDAASENNTITQNDAKNESDVASKSATSKNEAENKKVTKSKKRT